ECGTFGFRWRMVWAECCGITSTSRLPRASAPVPSMSCSLTARSSGETSAARAAPAARTAHAIQSNASFALFISLPFCLEQRGVGIVALRVHVWLGKHELRAAQRRRQVLARRYVMQLRHERLRIGQQVFIVEPRRLRVRRP